MVTEKRASILCIMLVLLRNTDEDHKLTQPEIAEKVEKDFGLSIERKSISSAIDTINSCFDDGEIEICKTGKGVFVKSRLFDFTELTFLADCVFNNSSLSNKVSADFLEKLGRLTYDPDNMLKSRQLHASEFERTRSYDLYTNYEIINQALKDKTQITFNYLNHYDEKDKEVLTMDPKTKLPKQFNFSPYYLVMAKNGKHYVIGAKFYDEMDKLACYRVDQIRNIQIKSKYKRKSKADALSNPSQFSLANFLEEHPKMFVKDKPRDITFKMLSEKGTLYVHEEFGFKTKTKRKNDGHLYMIVRTTESAAKLFCLDYYKFVELVEPSDIKDSLYKDICQLYDMYKYNK